MAKKKRKIKTWPKITINGKIFDQVDYDRELAAQNNGCAICHRTADSFPSKRKLCVDHFHGPKGIGEFRGLLCFICNCKLVGRISSDNAIKVAKYLNPNLTIFIF